MPSAAPKPCTAPGCGKLVSAGPMGGGLKNFGTLAPETDLLAIFSRAQVFDPGGTPSTHKAGQNFRQ